jgi:predicted lipid-binding transport protein (Tim44 family)
MADIIFLVIVAAFVVARLYSLFGTGSEEKKVQIVLKPVDKETEDQLRAELSEVINARKEAVMEKMPDMENMSEQDILLSKIPAFNKNAFINGANKVFEMVVLAFNAGNMESVKELISKKILTAFNNAIQERRSAKMTSEVDFICFDKSEIKDVKLLKNSARIVVEFISEQVNILRDAEGHVIEGDENFIQKIKDVWTFERSLNANSNKWLLVSTKKSA